MYSSAMGDPSGTATTVEPASYVHGTVRVPGDKSISHRYAILAALADGRSTIRGYAPGADCSSTLRCLEMLGVAVDRRSDPTAGPDIVIDGRGVGGLQAPDAVLDAGNSGTTLRLLSGVLAGHSFRSVLTGDGSLRRRPMGRIVRPLEAMGARIESVDGHPPLTITGRNLRGAELQPSVASAQVKSAILLAGLHATGDTWVREPMPTRDHTERALPVFGVEVARRDGAVGVSGGGRLTAADLTVPGDFSSAAFWLVTAAALSGSSLTLPEVGLNPSRTRLIDTLRAAGAEITVEEAETGTGEPMGTIHVRHGERRPITVEADDVPALIDELPALAALAVHGGGIRVTGARELRAKESDRITVLATGLRQMGARVEELPDGFEVDGTVRPGGGTVDASGDHRMAMAFAVAALGATGPTTILGHDVVDVSYPGFFDTLDTLRHS